MYPHERSLVQELAGKPFALVGVNSDSDLDSIRAAAQKENITWRSFFDGGGTDGPISTRWNVSGWPTVYLIDHEGVIRAKAHSLDEALLDRLVVEAAEAAAK